MNLKSRLLKITIEILEDKQIFYTDWLIALSEISMCGKDRTPGEM